jgi:CRP/FNR family transcriptional regulator, cyclic AMP receptor protein
MKLPNIFETDTPPISYKAGAIIFAEGEPRDKMYVVKTGAVDLLVRGEVVETVWEDGFFGAMTLIDHEPRSATALAKSDCSLIPITERQFLFLVQTPFFALSIMRTLATRLRKRNMKYHPV